MPLDCIKKKLLSEVSTLGIGGPAKLYVEVKTVEEMIQALSFCKVEKLSFFILGKGSNSLFDDRGFDGVIIHNKIDFIEENDEGHFHVGAGYSFSLLGMQTAKKGFTGLEFAAGIPASVGGAVFMNAGAQGKETCSHLVSVEFIDADGNAHHLKKEDLEFGYRFSSFQKMQGAIISARFQLAKSKTAKKEQRELLDYRIKTQPYHEKSAGCVFRNPVNGSAGALIDKSGLKGISIGDAEVSFMHANFLINKGNATSDDFKKLMDEVRNKVREVHGVDLEVEIRLVPYKGPNCD